MVCNQEELVYSFCPVCSSSIQLWKTKSVEGVDYKIDICKFCGYAFVNPRPSLSFLFDFYSPLSEGKDRVYNDEIQTLETVVQDEISYPNATVDAKQFIYTINDLMGNSEGKKFLDVGCGYGFFLAEAKVQGFEVFAIELAQEQRSITKEMTGVTPVAISFEEFVCQDSSLSVVLMSQILEHVQDINLWIEKAYKILNTDGILVIALPNFNRLSRLILKEKDAFIVPPEHLNFFSYKSLKILLEAHDFELERVEWVSRIPLSSIEKRIPKILMPIIPLLDIVVRGTQKVLDALKFGTMITVYARKK
jgi:2-polyprenyl-3-methyl-5-hydroxy-6-metoxy-1,4-benzoquinol methylase